MVQICSRYSTDNRRILSWKGPSSVESHFTVFWSIPLKHEKLEVKRPWFCLLNLIVGQAHSDFVKLFTIAYNGGVWNEYWLIIIRSWGLYVMEFLSYFFLILMKWWNRGYLVYDRGICSSYDRNAAFDRFFILWCLFFGNPRQRLFLLSVILTFNSQVYWKEKVLSDWKQPWRLLKLFRIIFDFPDAITGLISFFVAENDHNLVQW